MTRFVRVGDVLAEHGVAFVYHVTPLHYLPAIAERNALLSKTELRNAGFRDEHFRPTSRKRDSASGFDSFVHTMSVPNSPLLLDKLKRRLAHARIGVPTEVLPDNLLLCRYNIAKHRIPAGKFPEGPAAGYLVKGLTVPVASTPAEADQLLQRRQGKWVEVLVPDRLDLREFVVTCFDRHEADAVGELLAKSGMSDIQVQHESSGYKPPIPNPALAYIEGVLKGLASARTPPALRYD